MKRIFESKSASMHLESVGSTLFTYLVGFLLVFAMPPRISGVGLDPSWSAAIAEATSRGLSFGSEIIFTFGPYSTLLTREYNPGVVGQTIWAGLLLSLSVGYFLDCLRIRTGHHFWILLTLFSLFQVLSFEYFLLSFFSLSLILIMSKNAAGFHSLIALLPFALFPLVKGSMAIGYVLFGSIFLIWILREGRFLLFFSVISSQISAMVLFWLLSGQSFFTLPNYFTGMYQISAGYARAMSLPGIMSELVIATFMLVGATSYFLFLTFQNKGKKFEESLILLLLLFLAFKAGFVRHDGHALNFAFVAISVPAIWSMVREYEFKTSLRLLIVPTIVAIFIAGNHTNFNPVNRFGQLYAQHAETLSAVIDPQKSLSSLQSEFDQSRTSIADSHNLEHFCPGASDVYPWETSALISSLSWNPRPVFQSYSVYTPYLRKANEKHLEASSLGTRIIVSGEAIDDRLPFSMEPNSIRLMKTDYEIISESHLGFCLERVRKSENPKDFQILGEESIEFGDVLEIPPGNDEFLYLKIEANMSLLARAVSLFFRPAFVYVDVIYESGKTSRHRFIPSTEPEFFPVLTGGRENLRSYISEGNISLQIRRIEINQAGFSLTHWDPELKISYAR